MSTPQVVIFPAGNEAEAAGYLDACNDYLTEHGQSANTPWYPPEHLDFYGSTVVAYLGPGNSGWNAMFGITTPEATELEAARVGGVVATGAQMTDPNEE